MKNRIIQELNSSNKMSRLFGLEKIYKLIGIEKKQFKKAKALQR